MGVRGNGGGEGVASVQAHRGIGLGTNAGVTMTGGYNREWNWFWAVLDKNILGNPQPDRATYTGG